MNFKKKKKIAGYIVLVFLFISPVILKNCDTTSADFDPIKISGEVRDVRNQEPLPNAIARVIQPSQGKTDVTDQNGRFSISMDVDSTMDIRVVVSKEHFHSDTLSAVAVPERDIDLGTIRLKPKDEDFVDEPDRDPGKPAVIVLENVSALHMNVLETGGIEQSTLGYHVTDSHGTPVDGVEVAFRLGSSPGGGEYISPESATTNILGNVTATLTSGTISGTVQVIASIDVDGHTIKSRPVRVTIHSGLPSSDHFTLYRPVAQNITETQRSVVTVLLGDRYGNPVSNGTSVYFSTTGGVIDGSLQTCDDGTGAVELRYGLPVPDDGLVTVTAQTTNEFNETIKKEALVLFSTPHILINVTPSHFDIDHLSDQTFNYTVTDSKGNPLVEGTRISVSVEGEAVDLIGDVDTVLGDHITGGPGITEFAFNVAGTNEEPHEHPRPVFIEISAETPISKKTVLIQGRKAKELLD